MKWGVVVFPGTNREPDAHSVFGRVLGHDVRYIWHKETDISDVDAIMLPGGFSYGDYLRSGAIAGFSPVMNEIINFAGKGGLVFGVCNGFQILTEVGLLPGTLLRNRSLRFINDDWSLRIERNDTAFTSKCDKNQIIRVPIAHNEGNYFLEGDNLKRLEDRNGVVFRYCSVDGVVDDANNPNGSINNIAGVINEAGNVLGMMPHPEDRCDSIVGSTEGLILFESMVEGLAV